MFFGSFGAALFVLRAVIFKDTVANDVDYCTAFHFANQKQHSTRQQTRLARPATMVLMLATWFRPLLTPACALHSPELAVETRRIT